MDAEFEALLCSIFSSDFVDGYKRQFPVGWVNLMTDFESRKRAASPFKTTSFNVSLPFTFISEFRKHRVSGVRLGHTESTLAFCLSFTSIGSRFVGLLG